MLVVLEWDSQKTTTVNQDKNILIERVEVKKKCIAVQQHKGMKTDCSPQINGPVYVRTIIRLNLTDTQVLPIETDLFYLKNEEEKVDWGDSVTSLHNEWCPWLPVV